ncbi:SDR family NAD(P)-dependent oxidoreductase [Dactylosporangium roseum]|uniref:SDR family NAD(P)-dependent oxidoreductase n=1 Tax=Dactylosporangium roseum TaxID=47989 RepID=A0ABY5YYW7_9ACTN|nr:type I polyketide synthase [Dactylosporangium roseum]UWZ34712.1 SDR family NAD(P)-dependent oxidoreductase [Dactylosporangium roseum]
MRRPAQDHDTTRRSPEPVAVIGMASRLPGAENLEQFWQVLSEGTDCFSTRTDDDLRAAGVDEKHLADPDYVRRVPLLADADGFDAEFFGLTPREADMRDPQQRLFLELAHAALEDAGYDPFAVPGSVGVFGGSAANRYAEFNIRANKELAARTAALSLDIYNNNDYLASTVSYRLGLTGPALSVATACSTSLVAVHLACEALRNGECETALAGGAELEMPYGHGYRWAPGSIYSQDGFCRPFDVKANGTVFGNGGGVVVLKLLADARADGDPIRAVIRGSAVTNDGADRVSFSAPGVDGQLRAVVEAMTVADLTPADIDYVEAHGTGTDIGDSIEVEALTGAYRFLAGDAAHATPAIGLGSVKSNIGHLGPAAGVAGLIKAVLCMEHGELVPTVHFTEANPKLNLGETPFRVVQRRDPWPVPAHRPRTAAVSSFGVGGTNAHVVLEQGPPAAAGTAADGPELLVWSARTDADEPAVRARLARHLTWHGEDGLVDTATTLRHGRTVHRVRRAVVAPTARAAVDLLDDPAEQALLRPAPGAAARQVALLFPGQGAQRAGMAAGLLGYDTTFTHTMRRCLDIVAELGVDLEPAWHGPHAAELLTRTEFAQPLLASVGYSLAAMWRAWGVAPVALLGHSVGELVAAMVAGVTTLEDGLRLVTARALAMQAMPAGSMLAVAVPEEDARALLGGDIALAAVNGPRQCVLSGPAEAIEAVAGQARAAGVRAKLLDTSHAFHSPAMAGAADRFREAFDGVLLSPPAIPIVSAATGQPLTDEQAADPAFWSGQLTAPVRFGPALARLLDERKLTTLEAGPGRTLTALVRGHGPAHHAVAGLGTGDDRTDVLAAAGALWTEGHDLRWDAVGPPRPRRRIALPGYPYRRARHWISPSPVIGARPVTADQPAPETAPVIAETAAAPASPLAVLRWRETAPGPRPPRHRGTVALTLMPRDPDAARRVTRLLSAAGHRVVPVQPDTLPEVLRELRGSGAEPGVYVHAAATGAWPEATADTIDTQLADSVESAYDLVRVAARTASAGRPGRFLFLATQAADVSGGEPVHPAKAALAGLARTVPLELPGAACLLLDVSPGTDQAMITQQLQERDWPPVVALRGDRRWIPAEVPIPHRPATEAPVRPGGTYLITGGYGGIGLAVARGLARTGLAPTLVLVGRSGPRDAAAAELSELEQLGARVLIERADVTDEWSMRALVERVEATAGPVHGVLHAAGLPGDGMIAFRTPEQVRAVLRPKIVGALVLERVFAERPRLDFFTSFSSRASIAGLVGSADYAAANAFLDAHATVSRQRCVSINWPSWAEVGMAARATVDPGSGEPLSSWAATRRTATESLVHEEELTEQSWVLDEHRFAGRAVLPGTAHLDLVVRAVRRLCPPLAGIPIVLREVTFHQPLFVQGAQRVRVILEPRDSHWDFTVQAGATVHSSGRVAAAAETDAPRADLAAVAARMTETADATGAGDLAELGPHWLNVEQLRRSASEQLATLRLADRFHGELAEHPLHPALLDSATALTRRAEDHHHLPMLYGEITVFSDLPGAVTAHVRHRDGGRGLLVTDVDLVRPDGLVAVAVRRFTMRQVSADAFTVAPGGGDDRPTGLPPSDGIPPGEGVALLFDILGDRPGRQVAVRPYRDGRPVPGEQDTPAAAEPVIPPAAAPVPAPRPSASTWQEQDLATVLEQAWQNALGRSVAGPQDDFFALGGDSLSAVGLIAELRDRLGIELSVGMLFEFPTIGSLSATLRGRMEGGQ